MLGFLDAGRRILPKIRFERDDMGGELALRSVVVEFFQLRQAAVLIEFKIFPEGIVGDADQFRNLGMGQPMRFQPQGIHPALDERRKMIVAVVIQFFQNLWRELKLDGHRQNHTRWYTSLSRKPHFVPALGIMTSEQLLSGATRVRVQFLTENALRVTHAPASAQAFPPDRPWLSHVLLPPAPAPAEPS